MASGGPRSLRRGRAAGNPVHDARPDSKTGESDSSPWYDTARNEHVLGDLWFYHQQAGIQADVPIDRTASPTRSLNPHIRASKA